MQLSQGNLFTGISSAQIFVTTVEGKVVYRANLVNGAKSGKMVVDAGRLAKGLYIVRLTETGFVALTGIVTVM